MPELKPSFSVDFFPYLLHRLVWTKEYCSLEKPNFWLFCFDETLQIFLSRTRATRNIALFSPTWLTQRPTRYQSLSSPRGCSRWLSPSSTRLPTPPPTSSNRSSPPRPTRDCDRCTTRRDLCWNDWRYHRTCRTSHTSWKWQSNQFKWTFIQDMCNGLTRFSRT